MCPNTPLDHSERDGHADVFARFLGLLVLLPSLVLAGDCRPGDIQLGSQTEVDQFQASHGPCDTVRGNLGVQGSDVSSLAGLTDIVRVDGDLIVAETQRLTDLTGLSGLRSVGGDVGIFHNFGLLSVDGLSSLTRVKGAVGIFANPEQKDVDALAALTEVGDHMIVSDLHSLTDVDGLSALVTVGNHLGLILNHALTDLDGLSALIAVGGRVQIGLNDSLTQVDGLRSLASVGFQLDIFSNPVLSTLDGLSAMTEVGFDVIVESNPVLAECTGLLRLLDSVDDGVPGPGSFESGVPDVGGEVILRKNLPGCNAIAEIGNSRDFVVNAGLNDAWYNPATPGQGLFVTVLPDAGGVFLSWMTFDLARPAGEVLPMLGDAGHRWLTAFGLYAGNEAMLELMITSGGVFDTPGSVPFGEPAGSVHLRFTGCNAATVRYDIPALGKANVFHIERIAHDNIALCTSLLVPPGP